MKLFFTKSSFFLFFITVFGAVTAKGQTTLIKGDIAFVGYIGANNLPAAADEFSFVLLRSITTGTVINFTDVGWLRNSSTTGVFNSTNIEGTSTWTSNAAYPAGTEIKVLTNASNATYAYYALGTPTTNGNAGTFTGASPMSFSVNGDAIIAYQGTAAAPTFISAIHMNVYNNGIPAEPITSTANWDGNYATANACGLPALTSVSANNFLTNGVDAIWIPGSITAEVDNARFNCTGPLTSVAQIRAAVYDVTNWTKTDGTPPGFTLPTGCNYLGLVLPIKLISFKAQNILADVQLNWSATEQTEFSHFELERSFDGVVFKYIATIAALPGAGTIDYNYSDKAALKTTVNAIYYRLKMVDVDGTKTYSHIVKLSNTKSKDFELTNFQNPLVGNKINFELLTSVNKKVAFSITDLYGRQLYKMQQDCTAGRNKIIFADNLSLSTGVYFLNIQLENEPIQSMKFVKN
jgi:hypothetical protein